MRGKAPPPEEKAAIVNAVLLDIADGSSTRGALKKHKLHVQTWWDWLERDPAIQRRYVDAKRICAEVRAEEIIELSDEPMPTITDERGKVRPDWAAVHQRKLQVDARKWAASHLDPKRYGDKVQTEVSGADGGALKIEVVKYADDPASS